MPDQDDIDSKTLVKELRAKGVAAREAMLKERARIEQLIADARKATDE